MTFNVLFSLTARLKGSILNFTNSVSSLWKDNLLRNSESTLRALIACNPNFAVIVCKHLKKPEADVQIDVTADARYRFVAAK